MAHTWLLRPAAVCILGAWAGACGAFAEAGKDDGGQPNAFTTLVFDTYEVMRQGETRNFLISFADPPPWADGVSKGFLTRFRFVDEDDESKILDDIFPTPNYDGFLTIDAKFIATREAQIGPRQLIVRAAFEEKGKPQQFHEGRGTFYVIERLGTDGGADGGDQ